MGEQDSNWNGAYNTAANISPLSQVEGGVLPTDTPLTAYMKGAAAEAEHERRKLDTGNGGADIVDVLNLLVYLAFLVLGGFLIWKAGVFVYREFTDTYDRVESSLSRVSGDIKFSEGNNKAITYIIMSSLRVGGDRQFGDVTNYINTSPDFSEFRENIRPKLKAANSPHEYRRTFSDIYKRYASDEKSLYTSPTAFALRYYCQLRFPSGSCGLFHDQSLVREVLRGNSFMAPEMCAPLLHLKISRAVQYPYEGYADVEELIDSCVKIRSDSSTTSLQAKLGVSKFLSNLFGLLPDKYSAVCANGLVTTVSLVRSAIFFLIYG